MRDGPEDEIGLSHLFDLARNNKYSEVTETAISRWARVGLLPRGRLERRGRNGTRRLFPRTSGPQLLALCEIHYTLGERRIRYVAWRLWRRGYPVNPELIREFLLPVAEEWQSKVDRVKDADEAELERMAAEAAKSRLRDSQAAGFRKRVGREAFPDLVRTIFKIMRGEPISPEESALLVKGFGLQRALTDYVWQDRARMFGSIERISELTPRMLSEPLPALIQSATDEELTRLRDVFGLHVEAMITLGRVLGRWISRDAFGLGVISEILAGLDPAAEAGILLLGLTVLRTTDIDPALIEAEQEWVRIGVRAAEALEGLMDIVPNLRPLMSPKKVQAALRFQKAGAQRLKEIAKVSAPHRAVVTAFISKDPSLRELIDEQ